MIQAFWLHILGGLQSIREWWRDYWGLPEGINARIARLPDEPKIRRMELGGHNGR